MKEIGLLNREISDVISRLGHGDEICICDAGLAIPNGVRDIDISLKDNSPGLIEVLAEILKYFSVEKLIIAKETKIVNPSMFERILEQFNKEIKIEVIPHVKLKERTKRVKAIIRTGEFTAYTNIILISGADDKRWVLEKDVHWKEV
jgi:D-ribose pyranase